MRFKKLFGRFAVFVIPALRVLCCAALAVRPNATFFSLYAVLKKHPWQIINTCIWLPLLSLLCPIWEYLFLPLIFLLPFLFISFAFADTVPEPEPDSEHYVRACDAYGAGYFYIPGTNTCLRISGYIRADLRGGDNVYAMKYSDRHYHSYSWLSRGTVRFHTASETDLGTLRSFMELRSDWQNGQEVGSTDDTVNSSIRFAYIELGGLRVGMDETIFAYWTGYYGNMINDDVMNPTEKRTNGLSYTFNLANSFSAIIGFEQGNHYRGNGTIPDYNNINNSQDDDNTINGSRSGGYRFRRDGSKDYRKLSTQTYDYTPYIVGGLKYEQGWGTVSTVIGYDSYDSEWAAKLRFDANLTDHFSIFAMGGYKSMDDYYNLDTSYGQNGVRIKGYRPDGTPIKQYGIYRQVNSIYGDWGGHGIAWFGGTYKFSPQMSLNFENAYADDRSFSSSVNITKDIVSGLTLICEVSYKTWHDQYGYKRANGDRYRLSLKDKDAVQGSLRLQRSF